ncbi:phage tail-collar fiber domain-containing protein [Ewingella allii]|uniref:phage tail-collar fiber domain-containing protein n=1 Tax=Ewingella allii TaxID=3092550 RepID=UPI00379FB820
MSQAVITKAFVEWKARQAIDNQPVVLDEFIFANVPGLDVNKPIDNTEGVPSADHIVHRQAVSKAGAVNAGSVVYSVTMGAEVGDFSFNWIGLANKATGVLAMIIHAPMQQKIKNDNGQQGNVLVRSMLMEYSGALAATNINTPAETWQIDFTARLAGMDEAERLANKDIYGNAAFFDAGFLVAKTGQQFYVTQGVGYVGGLRAGLASNENITVGVKPVKVWVDVCYQGTLTSAYQTVIKFTLAEALQNYVSNGIAHYVFALANIDAAGNITDLRPKGSLNEQDGNSTFVRKDKNLADIADPQTALSTLGGVPKIRKVNNKALTDDIALTSSDVGALPLGGTAVAANKLATPRKIAGVDFDGSTDISLAAGNVGALPSGGTAVAANKLATARKIAGVDFDGSKDINITASNVGAVQQGGGQNMGPNKVMLGWDGGKLIAQVDDTPMGALYSERNKPTAEDTGAVSVKGGDVGYLNNADHYKIKPALWEGYGSLAGQYSNAAAPFFIPRGHRADATVGQYAPMIKAIVETAQYGFPAAISLGAYTAGDKRYPSAVIHVITDNGTSMIWQFDPNNGRLTCPGEIHSGGNIISASGVYEERGATRVYSPNYRPTPADVGALPATGGQVNGPINTAGELKEWGQRVFSPNNPQPTPQGLGEINTYLLALTPNARNPGDLVAGSELQPSTADGIASGWAVSGTWRCMGMTRTINDPHRTTLWMRVS